MLMKNITKKITALVLGAVMLLSLCACDTEKKKDSGDAIPESSGGHDIVRAKAADNVFSLNFNRSRSLNPLIATDHANQLICALVYENMVELDNNFEVIPNVIKEWKMSDDAKTWTFTIEEGHVFHDGSPVTGKDLRYTMDRAVNSDRYQGRFASVQGIGHSEDTLVVTLGIPDTQFVKLLNLPIIKSGSYNDKPPLGSGPMYIDADLTELTAYDGYAGYDTMPVKKVYLKEYPEAADKIIAYEDSLIDLVINDPSSYTSLGFASTNEIHKYSTTNLHYVAFNETTPLGRMNTFRVAMQYAFDRDYFVELLHQNAVATAVPMYPGCKDYPQSLNDDLRYNLEKCENILKSIGFRDYDDDGYLELLQGNGEDVEINFLVCSGSSAKGGVVNRFAQDMQTLGIKVNVFELPWDEYVEVLQEGKYGKKPIDMYYGEVRLRNNFDLTELLQVRTKDNENRNLNFSGSKDTAFVEYINQYLGAADAGRADAYYKLCDYISHSSGSLISIGFEKHQLISHRGVVKGIDANAGNPLYNFENWEIMLDD